MKTLQDIWNLWFSKEEQYKINLSEQILFLRKKLNLTQKEFGDKLGIKQPNIAQLENAKRLPSHEMLLKIVKTFDVDLECPKFKQHEYDIKLDLKNETKNNYCVVEF